MRYFGWILSLHYPNGKHKKDELLNDWGATLVQKELKEKKTPLKFPFTHMLANVINTHCER